MSDRENPRAEYPDQPPRNVERRSPGNHGRRRTDRNPDSALDKGIAYFSYYVLVFTAACIFTPVETANALSYARHAMQSSVKMTVAPTSPDHWNMRGSAG